MAKAADCAQGNSEKLADDAVLAQLERVLSSSVFIASPSLAQFLQFVVTETLSGRRDRIKAYTIAVNAWGRERDFDPQADPIVRIQAGRLRRALKDYYGGEGVDDAIHIALPKGTYVPRFNLEPVAGANNEPRPSVAIMEQKEPSVAVLPLQNLSGDETQAPFVDGFGEELAVYLSRFQAISVIAYYSCRRFRDLAEDVRAIGRQLGADFLVTGSFFRDDSRLRISVALNDAQSGVQLWGQQFDQVLTAANFFAVQDEIIEQIVAAIGSNYGVMPRLVARASREKRTDDLSVYEAVLRRTTFLMDVSPAAHRDAEQALERAVTIDPTYAPAWAALGGMYAAASLLGMQSRDDLLGQALDCIHRALRLDPFCQDAYSALANVHLQRRDPQGVGRACLRMVDLNPNDASALGLAGFWLALAGDNDRGLTYLDKAIARNPFFPGWFHLPYLLRHFKRGEYDKAFARAVRINMPGLFWDPLLRAVALSRMGHVGEAQSAVRELLRLEPEFPERADRLLGKVIIADDLREQMLVSLHAAGLPDKV